VTTIERAAPHRTTRDGIVTGVGGIVGKGAAADWLFAGVMVLTAWWYVRASRGQSFLRDDWNVATRSLSLTDLFQPYNDHLSVVPLAIYRVMLGEFGMETYTPERVLGSGSLLCLGVALFLFARSRAGAPVALVVAVSVLWLPTTNLTPFMANYHFALVCAVVCAAAMPSGHRRSDVVIGLALAVAFVTSGVAVAVAAACTAHAVMSRARLSRWVAIAVPSLGWVWWWRTLGRPTDAPARPSFVEGLGDVADGVFGSFAAMTWGSWVGGAVLLAGWVALLVHRVRADRESTLTQLGWTVGLVVWWAGVAWSRPGAIDLFGPGRYEYVGAVLILLSVLPARPVEWRGRPEAHWRMAALALVVIATIVLVNHDELRTAAQARAGGADRAEMVLYELEAAAELVEPTSWLPPEMARITVEDYREKVVPRYGSPIDLSEAPDEGMIDRSALRVPIVGPAPRDEPACATGPVLLYLGGDVALHAGDQPAMVRARRFGSSMLDVDLVPARMSAVVRFPGPTVNPYVPWVIEAPGTCIHAS
jgi:hypothetical protein